MATPSTPMRFAITGASGTIGQALTPWLTAQGHSVVPVSRRAAAGGVFWDPLRGVLDPGGLAGIDAVVHLAGENIAGGRWTPERKRVLRESRIGPTRLLAETLALMSRPPHTLISASAVGIYGDRGDALLEEGALPATDFLGALATDWEAAADPARAAGVRVVHPRFGVVLTPSGGALARMLPPFRLGLGGPVGSGKQWMPWIALDDALGVIGHLLSEERLKGPVNAVAPEQVTNAQFGQTLGRVLHRPAVVPLPAIALKLAFGEMAEATLLASQRVVPRVLQESGFEWQYPTLERALQHMIGLTPAWKR